MKTLFCLLMVLMVPVVAFSETGTIEGTVYNNNTKTPIAGAEVRILQTDERQKTDENGKFVFSTVPEGTYTLVTTVPETELIQSTSVVVAAAESQKIEIYVTTEQSRLESVEVTGKRVPKTVSKKSIQAEEITRLPGTAGDALRALPAIPESESQMTSAVPSTSVAVPMKITSTTLTEYPSVILTTSAELSRL